MQQNNEIEEELCLKGSSLLRCNRQTNCVEGVKAKVGATKKKMRVTGDHTHEL